MNDLRNVNMIRELLEFFPVDVVLCLFLQTHWNLRVVSAAFWLQIFHLFRCFSSPYKKSGEISFTFDRCGWFVRDYFLKCKKKLCLCVAFFNFFYFVSAFHLVRFVSFKSICFFFSWIPSAWLFYVVDSIRFHISHLYGVENQTSNSNNKNVSTRQHSVYSKT